MGRSEANHHRCYSASSLWNLGKPGAGWSGSERLDGTLGGAVDGPVLADQPHRLDRGWWCVDLDDDLVDDRLRLRSHVVRTHRMGPDIAGEVDETPRKSIDLRECRFATRERAEVDDDLDAAVRRRADERGCRVHAWARTRLFRLDTPPTRDTAPSREIGGKGSRKLPANGLWSYADSNRRPPGCDCPGRNSFSQVAKRGCAVMPTRSYSRVAPVSESESTW